MKCLYLSRKLEKADVGNTTLPICSVSWHLVSFGNMSSEGPLILKIIYGWTCLENPFKFWINSVLKKQKINSKIYLHCQEWHLSIQTTLCQLPVCCEVLPAKELHVAREHVGQWYGSTVSIASLWEQWLVLNAIQGETLKAVVKWEKRYWSWASKRGKLLLELQCQSCIRWALCAMFLFSCVRRSTCNNIKALKCQPLMFRRQTHLSSSST